MRRVVSVAGTLRVLAIHTPAGQAPTIIYASRTHSQV